MRQFCLSETIKKPRLCGEYSPEKHIRPKNVGSSPLARGIHLPLAALEVRSRIIPACAGNTCPILLISAFTEDHPRLRGEYVAYALQRDIPWGSSPLARGILNRCVCKSYISRIIPACAGNTKSDKYCQNLYWDHPRLCGEYLLSPSIWCVMLGSSSLVRGIRGRNGTKGLLDRIIPACAGNTLV